MLLTLLLLPLRRSRSTSSSDESNSSLSGKVVDRLDVGGGSADEARHPDATSAPAGGVVAGAGAGALL